MLDNHVFFHSNDVALGFDESHFLDATILAI